MRKIASIEESKAIEKILKQLAAKATAPEATRRPPCRAPQRRFILTRRDLVATNWTMDEAVKFVILGDSIAREKVPFSNVTEKA